MTIGRAADTKKKDKDLTERTVMAMVSEMVEDRARRARMYVQFEALAATMGIKVNWDDHTGM